MPLKEDKEISQLEKSAIDHAADLLIEAGNEGIIPTQEKIQQLLIIWGIEKIPPNTQPTSGNTTTKEPSEQAEQADALEAKVTKIIADYLKKNLPPGNRSIFNTLHKEKLNKDLNTGRLFLASLEKSLANNDALEVIAQKVTLLHDFPAEVGGGQFNRMVPFPELRKKILLRLQKELSNYADALKDETFLYLFKKSVETWPWTPTHHQKEQIGTVSEGNPLTEAIIKMKLDFVNGQLEKQSG